MPVNLATKLNTGKWRYLQYITSKKLRGTFGGRWSAGRAARPNDGDSSSLVIEPNCAVKERRGRRCQPASQPAGQTGQAGSNCKRIGRGRGNVSAQKKKFTNSCKKEGQRKRLGGRPNAN